MTMTSVIETGWVASDEVGGSATMSKPGMPPVVLTWGCAPPMNVNCGVGGGGGGIGGGGLSDACIVVIQGLENLN